MKLQRQSKPIEPYTVRLQLQGDLAQSLQGYANYYEATYGESIKQETLITEMLSYFISHDRDFVKWQQHQEKQTTSTECASTTTKEVSHENPVSV